MGGNLIEAPLRDPCRFAPIFLLAPARSCSSIVCTMVGQHPQLAGLPELKLFSYATVGELEASLPRYWIDRGVAHRSPGLVRAIAEYRFHAQDADALALARTWLRDRSHWNGACVLDSLLHELAPRAGVEKSPENVADDRSLEMLSSAYPRARYLHLVRHPIATQRSAQEHWNRLFPERPLNGEPMAGVASWLETHCRILRFASALGSNRYMRVRAEDVLNHSRQQLGMIAEWLGIRSDSDAIEAMIHPERSPFARFGAEDSGIVGGNDPGFLSNPIPRKVQVLADVKQPPGWVGDESLWQMTADLANCLGY